MKRLLVGMIVLFINQAALSNNLDEINNIDKIQEAKQSRKVSCEFLINGFIDRIKKYNLSAKNKPPINAIVEINPYALSEAKKLDEFYSKNHSLRGPLHCVPVIVKDNINTFDMTTTSGSYALLGSHPTKDAKIISQLRKAGAIILAKGAMDEFAEGMLGISSRSGRIGNVYDTNKNPGGSSGGVAAAVSANFSTIGIGTDTTGSILIPSAFNGVVGLRPSIGLLNQKGIFPAGNIDTVPGPITRTVKDLAIIMSVLNSNENYTNNLNKNGLSKKRIGIITRIDNFDITSHLPNDMKLMLKHTIDHMQKAGVTVINNIDLSNYDSNRKYNMAGTLQEVDAYLSSFPAARKSFKEICESNRTRAFGNKSECLKFINSLPNKASASKAFAIISKNSRYVQKIMKNYQLDALLLPISLSGVATYDNQYGMIPIPFPSNAGFPSITLLVGYHNGMPISLELIGVPFSEKKLIEMANNYEEQFFKRREPDIQSDSSLQKFSTADLNNLFTLIGIDFYEKVLKQNQNALNGEIIKSIVSENSRKLFNKKTTY